MLLLFKIETTTTTKIFRRPNTKPPPPISKEIFSIRAYVRVDPCSTSQGGMGFVTAVYTEERKVVSGNTVSLRRELWFSFLLDECDVNDGHGRQRWTTMVDGARWTTMTYDG